MKHATSGRIVHALLLLLALSFAAGADAEQRSRRVVVFGDSLTDPGNAFVLTHAVSVPPYELIPSAPYARGGHHFTNGETWVEQLDDGRHRLHGACAALRAPRECSNYAVGAARARPGTPFDLETQVLLFLRDFSGAAPAEALYVVHLGANDIRDALAALATDPSGAASNAILGAALEAIARNVAVLASAGAREFLVPNAPDFALVPAVRLQGPAVQSAAHALSIGFNDALAGVLAHLEASAPVTIHRLNIFALIAATVARPAAAGLREVEAPCITPGVVVGAECRRPDEYLFWDGIHPTRAAHAIVAQAARALLPRGNDERREAAGF